MNIEIHSARDAARELHLNRGKWCVISLRSPDTPDEHHPVTDKQPHAIAMLIRKFDDVWEDRHGEQGYILPTKEDVQLCLDFVANQQPENLLIHCDAGVSRSSAIAYVIACTMDTPEEAIKLLNPMLHMPNERIIRYGAELLGNSEVWLEYQKFGDDLFAELIDR